MLIDAANLVAQYTSHKMDFMAGWERAVPSHVDICQIIPSDTDSHHYGWLGAIKGVRKWVGERQIHNLKAHSYTIQNETYEDTIAIPREDYEDDRYGIWATAFQALGFEARVAPGEKVFETIAAGETELGFDKVPFFSANHPNGASTFSNLLSGNEPAWYLLDTQKLLKPFLLQMRKEFEFVALQDPTSHHVFMNREFVYGIDGRYNTGFGLPQQAFKCTQALNETNLSTARAMMRSYTNDEGKRLNINPNLLLVGPGLQTLAEKLMFNQLGLGGESNVMMGKFTLKVSNYLP